jgi:hypothetical protein
MNSIPGLGNYGNLTKMDDPNLTFKGIRKKGNSSLAGSLAMINNNKRPVPKA